MCYVIEEKIDDSFVDICWFHDKETAHKILDYLETKNYTRDYEVVNVPIAYVREYDVPYCSKILETLGVEIV